MIKYNFTINEGGYPSMGIDEKYIMLWELGSLSGNQIRYTVEKLEKVKSGESVGHSFGYETTTISCCGKNHTKYPGKTFIDYNYDEDTIEVPFDDIYNLMKDWRDYIDKWEKKTGKKKK